MKKWILGIVSICVIFSLAVGLSACTELPLEFESDSKSDSVSEKETTFLFDPFDEVSSRVYPLDISYQNEMSKAYSISNAEMESVKENYISIWNDHIQYYYKFLVEIDDEQVFANKDDEFSSDIADFMRFFDGWKEALIEDQKNWEKNTDIQIATMQKLMNRIYTGASGARTGISAYKYSLYRQRALYLYDLCTMFHVDCHEPMYE